LSDLADQSKYHGWTIAIKPFGFLFKEKVLESNPHHPNHNLDMLFEGILNEVNLFIDESSESSCQSTKIYQKHCPFR
jgi:hypothetical protein